MVTTRSSSTTTTTNTKPLSTWSHAPTTTTLLWLAISLPLVLWDTGYVLGRPYTMPGGKWHEPIWTPYKLYGEIDYVYGFKAFHAGEGFTSAQGSLNVVETILYLVYLGIWHLRGSQLQQGGAAGSKGARKAVDGRAGALCALIGFSAALMTFSKTILYGAHEHFSGWSNVGHNSAQDLILLYIIPNGAWLVFSAYMVLSIGNKVLNGLTIAGSAKAKSA